ncbi:MAG: aspartate racemase, partial [Myxococcota bacterium]
MAVQDQDHLTIISLSKPAQLADRSRFLLGQTSVNPALAIVEQVRLLESTGAHVAGIPCNTAHAPPIMDMIAGELSASGSRLRLLHMINEVGHMLQRHYPSVQTVG